MPEDKLELEHEITNGNLNLYRRQEFGTGVPLLSSIGHTFFNAGDDLGKGINKILKNMGYDQTEYTTRELTPGKTFEGEYKPK